MCTKSFHLALTDPFAATLQELIIKVANFFHHHIHALYNGAIAQSTKNKIAIHIENQKVHNFYQLAKISLSRVDISYNMSIGVLKIYSAIPKSLFI